MRPKFLIAALALLVGAYLLDSALVGWVRSRDLPGAGVAPDATDIAPALTALLFPFLVLLQVGAYLALVAIGRLVAERAADRVPRRVRDSWVDLDETYGNSREDGVNRPWALAAALRSLPAILWDLAKGAGSGEELADRRDKPRGRRR
ncbi:MAG: hypothetical protein AAF682_00525 [Planctomycetota bacterium]